MTFNPNVTWNQISLGVKMSLGVRDQAYSLNEQYLQFRVGAGRPHRKIVIRLNRNDLYDIELGRITNLQWRVEKTATDVHAADLSATLLRLHDAVAGGR